MADERPVSRATSEVIYEALAEGVDRARDAAGDEREAISAECESLFLAKLALASLCEIGSVERAQALIDVALTDLARSIPESMR